MSYTQHSSPSVILTIQREDGEPMNTLLPWAVEDAALALTGARLDARYSRRGDLLVTASQSQAHELKKLKLVGRVPVQVSAPSHINRSQGSIWAPDLARHNTRDLEEGMAHLGVTGVYRRPETPVLILTFNTPHPPQEIRVSFLVFGVRVVVPRPRRCARCQRFGHGIRGCRAKEERCAVCAEWGHATCDSPDPVCAACEGSHRVGERGCPAWLLEQRVLDLIHRDGWEPAEARRHALAEVTGPDPWPPQRRAPQDGARIRLGDRTEFPSPGAERPRPQRAAGAPSSCPPPPRDPSPPEQGPQSSDSEGEGATGGVEGPSVRGPQSPLAQPHREGVAAPDRSSCVLTGEGEGGGEVQGSSKSNPTQPHRDGVAAPGFRPPTSSPGDSSHRRDRGQRPPAALRSGGAGARKVEEGDNPGHSSTSPVHGPPHKRDTLRPPNSKSKKAHSKTK